MIIDANLYWIPERLFTDAALMEAFLGAVPRGYGANAYESVLPETGRRQIVIEKPRGCQSLNYVQGQYEVAAQLADMDAAGIDAAVLKLPGCAEWMDLELCRAFNDGMAEHVRQGGGRFHALATVPPWGSKESLREVDRCVDELGMTGVQLSAHYGGLYLDHEAFRPLLRHLNERKLPVYVHHTPLPTQFDAIAEYTNLRRSYGRCVDQATAVGRELFSGMFDELPDLKLVHSMLGGAFFAFVNLMMPKRSGRQEAMDRFKSDNDRVRDQLRDNLFFEMSHAQPWGTTMLEAAIETVGADHVVFGTSYPVRREWLLDGPAFVKGLSIDEADKALILGGNAARIYGIR